MKIRCIVIDDEQPARELIKAYIEKVPHLEFITEFKNPLEAMSILREQDINLIFLDIQMPGLSGLEFIKTLNHQPSIILTTAYSQYALEGYELDVLDYLLKPISFERFLKAVNKIQGSVSPKIPVTTSPNDQEYLFVKSDGQKHRISFNEIQFIEGLKEYVRFHLISDTVITLESLKKLEETLPPGQFMRIHKSFIVNTKLVKSISGSHVIIGSQKIPVGQSYKEKVMKELF